MTRDVRLSWRTLAGALPAVALIGSGSVLLGTGGAAADDVAARSRPLVTVPAAPLTRPGAPVLPPLPPIPDAVAPSLPSPPGPDLAPALAASGIPSRALEAYKRGATLVDAADPACGIDWALIAAIGKVESDHGRYAGNGLDQSGTVRPGIYGLPLNGSNNTAVIRDTDGGVLDRDTAWDRAVGPMQFIPGTWRTVGVDADGDGTKNPQNMSDAATSTAVYLCSGTGDLTRDSDLRSAVLRYNHSDAYVSQVVAIADGYRRGVTVLPSGDLSAAQRAASPYLPSGSPAPVARTRPKGTPAPAPSPQSTPSARATGGPSTGSGSRVGTTAGPGGGASASPTPSASPTTGVARVLDGLTKPLRPTPTSSTSTTPSSPSPTSTSVLDPVKPVTNSLGQLVCPAGYELRLNVVPLLCHPEQ
jgi:hypothetical protein